MTPYRHLLRTSFTFALAALSFAPAAFAKKLPAPPPDPAVVADIVYPQSRAWQMPARSPAMSATDFANVKDGLEKAYRGAIGPTEKAETAECSFIQQALDGTHLANFHRMEINHDKIPDIVYAGPGFCGDSDAMVIWVAAGDHFEFRGPPLWPHRLLRMSPDQRYVTSLAVSWRDNRTDSYFLGSPFEPDLDEELRVVKDTELPRSKMAHPQRLSSKRASSLRRTPAIIDAPGDEQGLAPSNLIRTYVPGVAGLAVADTRVAGKRWLFVVLDAESDGRALKDPFKGVRVGWMPADDVDLLKGVAP
jgi:hypothetical protein